MSFLSAATVRNWGKLGNDGKDRLKSRANKTGSSKRVVPSNYLSSKELDSIVKELSYLNFKIEDVVYTLCSLKLDWFSEECSFNVKRFYNEYNRGIYKKIKIEVPDLLLSDRDSDWIGYIYQSLLAEGYRNLNGIYYTGRGVVEKMISDLILGDEKTMFDPCCGSGAFLMACKANTLGQLYGIDNDPLAVMIAKANLISKYPGDNVYPHIECGNYLEYIEIPCKERYDYICTNPPWGVNKMVDYSSQSIHSNERSSLFFVRAFSQLKDEGLMRFLLPTSLLKIRSHKDIRNFILSETKILDLHLYNEKFNGVFTDFFSISVGKIEIGCPQSYTVYSEDKVIKASAEIVDEFCSIPIYSYEDDNIVNMLDKGRYKDLSGSKWALGIVTGDNKGKLKKENGEGLEPIFTGKDIGRYKLKEPSHYIEYKRENFQQCAKEEMYRNGEKLVYKFISKNLCFAYDNSGSLFLNSANILIPNIDGMSMKTVLAFLNSELFSFYYKRKFMDIKILRGNLEALPFPKISREQDEEISFMVSETIENIRDRSSEIDEYIYGIYGISNETIGYIKNFLYGAFAK